MDADRDGIRLAIIDTLERNTWSLTDLAKASGLSHGALSKIQNKLSVPSIETCRKLAPHLGLRVEELMRMAGRSVEAVRRETRDEVLDRLLAMDATEVPFYDMTASASPSRSFGSDTPVDYGYLPERRRYAKGRIKGITVKGDCLAPRVLDGDRVFIDTQADYEDGDLVLAVVDDDLHLKRLRTGEEGYWLQPDNSEPAFRVTDGVFILGKYIGLWRQGI